MFGFKSENAIHFPAAPNNTNRMALADGVLPDNELVLRLVVRQFPLLDQPDDIFNFPKLVRGRGGAWGSFGVTLRP